VAVFVKENNSYTTYYVETDHLGSIIGLLRENGSYKERYSYDPWGRRRNPYTWEYDTIPVPTIIDRGFTGHEHLDQFGLINMNGRMYDPVVARFLGVDPIIQDLGNSQSYNGYSYCLNNPLKYIDPSGYSASETNGDPLSAYFQARTHGYNAGYDDFCNQYYDQYNNAMLGLPIIGNGGGSFSMTFSYYETVHSDGEMILLPDCPDCIPIQSINFTIVPRSLTMIVNTTYEQSPFQNRSNPFGPYTSWTGVIGEVAGLSANAKRVNAVRDVARMAKIDAQGAKVVTAIGRTTTSIGWVGEGVSFGVSIYNVWNNPTPGNWGRVGVSVGITATNFIPYAGPFISFGLTGVDVSGGFDNFYNWLDE